MCEAFFKGLKVTEKSRTPGLSNQKCTIIYCVHKRHMYVILRIMNQENSELLWYRPHAENDYLYAQHCFVSLIRAPLLFHGLHTSHHTVILPSLAISLCIWCLLSHVFSITTFLLCSKCTKHDHYFKTHACKRNMICMHGSSVKLFVTTDQ